MARALASAALLALCRAGAAAGDGVALLQESVSASSRHWPKQSLAFSPLIEYKVEETTAAPSSLDTIELTPTQRDYLKRLRLIRREIQIEVDRKKNLTAEAVKAFPRVSLTEMASMETLVTKVKRTVNYDGDDGQYIKAKIDKLVLKLHGEAGNVSHVLTMDGDVEVCREGPTLFMYKVLHQEQHHANSRMPYFNYHMDSASLQPGTCAAAGFPEAYDWSGCFPEMRAWLRAAPAEDFEPEERTWTRDFWHSEGGSDAGYEKLVAKICVDTDL